MPYLSYTSVVAVAGKPALFATTVIRRGYQRKKLDIKT